MNKPRREFKFRYAHLVLLHLIIFGSIITSISYIAIYAPIISGYSSYLLFVIGLFLTIIITLIVDNIIYTYMIKFNKHPLTPFAFHGIKRRLKSRISLYLSYANILFLHLLYILKPKYSEADLRNLENIIKKNLNLTELLREGVNRNIVLLKGIFSDHD